MNNKIKVVTMKDRVKTLMGKIFMLTSIGILFSCAASYKPIAPANLSYGSAVKTDEGLEYAYVHSILSQSGNKKYANRERKRPIKVMALEFTNNTNRVINFRRDVKIYMGNTIVSPVDPSLIHQSLKQPAALYLLWGLFWVVLNDCNGTDCNSTPLPVGLVIAGLNVGIASGANTKFLAELKSTNILDRDIAPGETVHGLIGITSDAAGSISLKFN
jgi:hypothetical protein